MKDFRCKRCGNESIIWLPSKKEVCCDKCRSYNRGIISMDYTPEIEHAYQIKRKRDD